MGQSWRNMAWKGNKKAFCILEFAKIESIVTVRWGLRTMYHAEPPTDKTIREWYMKFSRVAVCALRPWSRLSSVCEKRLLRAWYVTKVDISSTCKVEQKLWCVSLCWHAPLRCDHPGCCTTEVGNPGGTYELPCIFWRPVYSTECRNRTQNADLCIWHFSVLDKSVTTVVKWPTNAQGSNGFY
jgi:hypothetical protein